MYVIQHRSRPTKKYTQVGQTTDISDAVWLACLVSKMSALVTSNTVVFEAGNNGWDFQVTTNETDGLVMVSDMNHTLAGTITVMERVESMSREDCQELLEDIKSRCPNRRGKPYKYEGHRERITYKLTRVQYDALKAMCKEGESVNQCARRLALIHFEKADEEE